MRPDELALLIAVGRTLLAYIRGAGQVANIEDLYGLREALQPFEPPQDPVGSDGFTNDERMRKNDVL